MSRTRRIALAWLLAGAGGCYQADSAPKAADTNTNWLKCQRDDDCDGDDVCVAGVCVPSSSNTVVDAGQPRSSVAVVTPPDTADSIGARPEPVVEIGPASVDDLERCSTAAPIDWLLPWDAATSCASGPCEMRWDGVSALDDGRLLVLGFAKDDDGGVGGIPSFAVLEVDGSLSAFETIAGIAASNRVLSADRYLAVLEEGSQPVEANLPKHGLLYEWQSGVLTEVGAVDGAVEVSASGSRLLVAGFDGPPNVPWVTAYEASSQRWRTEAPEETALTEARSLDIAQDSDGSSSWIIDRYDDRWRRALVRVDATGNVLWVRQLGITQPAERPEDPVHHPSVATANGVTSIAGNAVTSLESSIRQALSLRQYDQSGTPNRHWEGLAVEGGSESGSSTPSVAGAGGDVYVAWQVLPSPPPTAPATFVILRFPDQGDPCVLAEGDGDAPPELILRDSDLVFRAQGGVGRVPR